MHFEPHNRHLLVLPLDTKKEEISFVLPEDYKKPADPYVVCDVLSKSADCEISVDIGDTIVIEARMLQEVKAMGETNYLVLENYVYGRIGDE